MIQSKICQIRSLQKFHQLIDNKATRIRFRNRVGKPKMGCMDKLKDAPLWSKILVGVFFVAVVATAIVVPIALTAPDTKEPSTESSTPSTISISTSSVSTSSVSEDSTTIPTTQEITTATSKRSTIRTNPTTTTEPPQRSDDRIECYPFSKYGFKILLKVNRMMSLLQKT